MWTIWIKSWGKFASLCGHPTLDLCSSIDTPLAVDH
jgi:hypothetical protein